MPVEKKGHKGVSPKVSQYYKVDNDKVTRERKSCARCGKGVFMSEPVSYTHLTLPTILRV